MIAQELLTMRNGVSMVNNIYFYSFKNFNILMNHIESYENVSTKYYDGFIECNVEAYKKDFQRIDKQSIKLYSKIETIKFIIIRDLNIISVISHKYLYIKDFCSSNNLTQINLLNNVTFNVIFNNGFSNNLVKISMKTLSLNAIINDIELVGHNLYESDILENLNSYVLDRDTKILKYSFKPQNYNFIVNITSRNKIEIRDRSLTSENISDFIYEFIEYLISNGGIYE